MKRLIFLALVGMVIASIAALGYKIVRGNAEKEAAQQRIQTLPDFRFQTSNGNGFTPSDVPPEKPLVIMHVLPECHFCQGEAKEIAAHAEFFQKAHILLVSAAEMKQIQDFGAYYGLPALPSLTLTRDAERSFAQTFGTASVPTTFVYSAEVGGKRKLLKQFTGETSAEALRKVLAQEASVGKK
ncbi:MAG: redoxin domain-containing protein [Candidatus Kapabacteria bacterium]|jgi:peroxiredoxin|nr:redoxin domain-containing protein [Candidatus Kapabacteria bacterium]